MYHETMFRNTDKNAVLFYVVPLPHTRSGLPARLFVTNRGIFKAVSGASFIHGVSTTARDRDVTLTFDGRGLVSHLEDHGHVNVTFTYSN